MPAVSAPPRRTIRPRRPRGRSRGFRRVVGAVLIATVALGLSLAYLKPDPFSHDVTVRAAFADASGIGVVGQDVRMAGVPVGKITGTTLEGDHALVTMQLDPSAAPVHSDATARLRPHLAFEGTAYIDLDPGSPDAPALADGTIPLSHTTNYVPLDEALRVFDPKTRKAFQADAHGAAGVLKGEGTSGIQSTLHEGPGLAQSLSRTSRAALGPHGTELAGAVQGLSRTSGAISTRAGDLGPLIQGADRTLSAVDTGGGSSLNATLERLPRTLSDLDSGGRAIDGMVTRLEPLAQSLEPGLAALAPTLDAAKPLVRQAGPVLTAATPFVSRLDRALGAGAEGAPEARGLLEAADPSFGLLRRSLLPALHQKTPELHIPAYLAFLNLFEGGGGASRPFQTSSDGNPVQPAEVGHFMRFGLRFLSGVGAPLPPCDLLAKANPSIAHELSARGGCTP
jgi:virulence factor Mce-like protein